MGWDARFHALCSESHLLFVERPQRGHGEAAAEETKLWGHRTCVHHVTAWDEQRAGEPRADLGTEETVLETTGKVVQDE